MRNFIMRVSAQCMVLFAILIILSCNKDVQLSKNVDQNIVDTALFATSTTSASYVVSTVAGLNSEKLPYPTYICSAADGKIYVVSGGGVPGIFSFGTNGVFTSYLSNESAGPIKAGANGSFYFVRSYVINNAVLDSFNVFKVDRSKRVTLVPVSEKLSEVQDLAIGPDSSIYLSEFNNSRIIKITKQGVQSVFAGKKGIRGFADGPRDKAHFTFPTALKFGEDGNLWVLDGAYYNNGQRIRKVSMDGTVTTLFTLKYDYENYNHITGFAVTKRDKNFNLTPFENVFFFVTKYTNGNRIHSNQLFHLSNTRVLTSITNNLPDSTDNYVGKDGPAAQATFVGPNGVTVNSNGIFVADQLGGTIRKIAKQQ